MQDISYTTLSFRICLVNCLCREYKLLFKCHPCIRLLQKLFFTVPVPTIPNSDYKQYRPGRGAVSGWAAVYQMFQSRGYCSKEVMMPWKLVSFSSSVMLSQATSPSHPEHGLSIWFSRSSTWGQSQRSGVKQ